MSNLETAVVFVNDLHAALIVALENEKNKKAISAEIAELRNEKSKLDTAVSAASADLKKARVDEEVSKQTAEKLVKDREAFSKAAADKLIAGAKADAAALVADAENRIRAAKQNEHESNLRVNEVRKQITELEAKFDALKLSYETFKRTVAA